MFVTLKYTRDTKPNDAMYAWLENLDNRGFQVCVREFLPFDGKHQDAVVVSKRIEPFLHLWNTHQNYIFSSYLSFRKDLSLIPFRKNTRWIFKIEKNI